jgi:hypothetical protein
VFKLPLQSTRTWTALACTVALVVTAHPTVSPADEAKIPDPRFSQVTPVLVGCSSGDAVTTHCPGELSASIGFKITLRDINNSPLYGKMAGLTFYAPGVRLYSEQEAGCTMDCALHTLEKVTDSNGVAVFHPRFGGYCNTACVEAWGEGVVVRDVPVRSTDMAAQGATTGLADFARFMPLYLAGSTTHPEADFDASGGPIGLSDFAIFSREYMLGAQGTYCP